MKSMIIVGVGPGLGTAIARRFAAEGYAIAPIARRQETVDTVVKELDEFGTETVPLTADAANEPSLVEALSRSVDALGVPDLVVYNAAIIQADAPGSLSLDRHHEAYAVNVLGALATARAVLPAMAERGRGSFVVTGGMPEPIAAYTSLSLGKAGVRALVRMLDETYRQSGVHVSTVTVSGTIEPGTAFDPDDIAEQYWQLHIQDGYQSGVEYEFRGRPPLSLTSTSTSR